MLGEDFHFIQTQPMEKERIKMGWGAELNQLSYLLLYYKQEEECKKLIMDSDVVLFGGVDDESYIGERLQAGKLVVRLSERIYKEGQWKAISPRGLIQKYKDHTKYRKSPVYLLCCGGYVASDFHIVHAYPDKMFQWGYFPRFIEENVDKLLEERKKEQETTGKLRLLWAGRFIDWKHPEYAIQGARRLKENEVSFHLTMIGGGDMASELDRMVNEQGLRDEVEFVGYREPCEVREYMRKTDIYLFTSDYREGWGAVLNEAMNSGCAVVANCGIGAVPCLIHPGKNGLIYPNMDFDLFYDHLFLLTQNEKFRTKISKEAYKSIATEWNPENAAAKLVPLLEKLLKGEKYFAPEGVLSKPPVIAPGKMYHYLTK